MCDENKNVKIYIEKHWEWHLRVITHKTKETGYRIDAP